MMPKGLFVKRNKIYKVKSQLVGTWEYDGKCCDKSIFIVEEEK